MTSLEERVERLEQREAIRQLLVDFVAGCDAGYDADRIIALFTTDAVMELGPLGRYSGAEEIHGFFAGVAEQIPFTVHLQTNYEIEIAASGAEASGRWYVFETPTIGERACWGAFTYEDTYRLVDGAWRIARLEQRFHFLTAFEDGWVKTPRVTL